MNIKPCNKLGRLVSRLNLLSTVIRVPLMSWLFGRVIKFAGTSKVQIEQLQFTESKLKLKNRKIVQNHIGTVHAAATALLGESATGFLLGMHVPDDRIPLLKSMQVDYIKRCSGDLTAVATLTDQQIATIRVEEKGNVEIKVVITDEAAVEPVHCVFLWAWVPKNR